MEHFQSYLLGGGILIGIAAAFWSKLKQISWRFVSLFVVRVKIEGDAATALAYWCWKNLKRSKTGERRYNSSTEFVQPVNRYIAIVFEQMGTDVTWFWKRWRPILLNLSIASEKNPQPSGTQLVVTTIRGLFNIEQMLIDSMKELNHLRHIGEKGKRFNVQRVFGEGPKLRQNNYDGSSKSPVEVTESILSKPDKRILQWKMEDIGTGRGEESWSGLAFPPEIESVLDEARRWLDSENWYRSKKIPWRRGWLFYGKPGTGKTSLARAVAQELDLPVICFDLASFGNGEFVREWRRLMNQVPCIALLEDIDAVFSGRENRLGEEGGGLTFDCLLNCLSGIEAADGVLIIVTTNRVEELDEALGKPDDRGLSTRPGRIDRAVELLAMDEECRRRIAERILNHCRHDIEDAVRDGDGDTGAQFQDRCSQIALRHYWNDQQSHRNGCIHVG